MITLQEYLDKNYKNIAKERVDIININNQELGLERSYLDLRDFKNLETLICEGFDITKIDISNCFKLEHLYFNSTTPNLNITNNPNLVKISWSFSLRNLEVNNNSNLTVLNLSNNELTNVSFLRNLPCPEKLIALELNNNNIQTTDLEIFRNFVNLAILSIGADDNQRVNKGFYNHFYGSLEPLRNLFNLNTLRIENTDISSGLEYLKGNLVETMEGFFIKCEVCYPSAKVKSIQDELKIYGYNLLD
ncbi:hypothetical protein C1645_835425 [Glomus cerebriforme]|uniref:Leucine-rich repeat domain-containing protein n=1 Tax=Glomus cerebriforme TaxID=658196 RepID=A0A397SHX0_9GLOM|nr:hypothetical protein C1645_835425 [Glomus cerebriforme]